MTDVQPGDGAGRPRRRFRVLLADDMEATRKLSSLVLTRAGHEVVTTTNGGDAAERALAEEFDVVLMDVQMPLVDGFEGTRRIREGETKLDRPRVPIVALTAHAVAEFRTQAERSGMDDFLVKPVQRKLLLDAVTRWAGGGGAASTDEEEQPADGYAEVRSEDGDPPSQEVDVIVPDPDIADLVPAYLERRRKDAWRCMELAKERDFDAVRRMGHNMKGSGRGYGLERVTKIGAAIEEAAISEDVEGIQRHAMEIESYLRRVKIVNR
jgi:CheY-like chemotaxis protein/HPt (histidine-containing phosphotransfer) domain-containing protein